MIDIHNHILVDIDDGPKTIEKSIALLKQAKDEGVTSIVATPHHLHPRYDNTFQQVLEIGGVKNASRSSSIGY